MNDVVIILNPWAGRGTAGKQHSKIEHELKRAGLDYRIMLTHARGGAIQLAWEAVEQGYTHIVAVGGDGTLHVDANGVKGAEATTGKSAVLGVMPFGTGSDFVKVFKSIRPNDITGGVQRILANKTKAIDLGMVKVDNEPPRFFINALGIGLDAQAAAEALKIRKLNGIAVYFLAIARAIMRYRAHPMLVSYEHQRLDRRLLFASIANGRCQAGGFWLTPNASVNDGLLDLCLVDNMRIDEIVRYIPLVMSGTHTRLRQVTMDRARKVQIHCSKPMPVATDGEVLSTIARKLQVHLIPEAIDFLV